jgi:hypothetical protein
MQVRDAQGAEPAAIAAEVYAFDPDAEHVAAAKAALPAELRERVRFAVHDAEALDMRAWARTIRSIDWEIDDTIRAGPFALVATSHLRVTDDYDDGQELVDVTRGWAGTRVDDELARLLARTARGVRVAQAVRLRVLRAR